MQQSRAITRQSASNLALAFCLLPRPKRDPMCALYAFCREVDNIADDVATPVAERRARLAAWREDVRRACAGERPAFPVLRELQPVIERYQLPLARFEDVLRGCEMDLEPRRYPDFTALEEYCDCVASAVGLLSIRIFGFTQPQCADYATHLGRALQLTNILRDVAEDAQRGRIYLPLAELGRCGITEQEILRGEYSARYRDAASAVAHRARHHYRRAAEVLPAADRPAMVAAELMGAVYWRLLRKLEQRQFNVFGPAGRVRLSRPHKVALILRGWLRHVAGARTSDYGHG